MTQNQVYLRKAVIMTYEYCQSFNYSGSRKQNVRVEHETYYKIEYTVNNQIE